MHNRTGYKKLAKLYLFLPDLQLESRLFIGFWKVHKQALICDFFAKFNVFLDYWIILMKCISKINIPLINFL